MSSQLSPLEKSVQLNDLALTDAEFLRVRNIIQEMTGINMDEKKRLLIHRRLVGRLKDLGMTTFRDYLKFLESGDSIEVELFTNAVTTNLTSFFRENHHFDFLRSTVIPEIVHNKSSGSRRLRIWSAGCSTGEEPYSIAMTLRESMQDIEKWDAKLLCTDLDTDVVATASNGVYPESRVEKVPQAQLKRWFRKSDSESGPVVRVHDDLRKIITFKQLNLMNDWPMRGRFDVIFCRNVVIYFDKPTQRILMNRYADILEDGGYLILGHSESLFNVSDRFTLLGQTIYKKKD